MSCSTCGFTYNCICSYQPKLSSDIEFALLYHQNEQARLTNTGKLIINSLPNTAHQYLWQRKEPPIKLIEKINQSETEAWLLFPSINSITDTQYLQSRHSNKKQLFILLDATWQEARKIVNKSTWLQSIPTLSLNINQTSHYSLRRNQNKGSLCTCEAGIEVLKMANEPYNAKQLNHYFEQFQRVFQSEKSGHSYNK